MDVNDCGVLDDDWTVVFCRDVPRVRFGFLTDLFKVFNESRIKREKESLESEFIQQLIKKTLNLCFYSLFNILYNYCQDEVSQILQNNTDQIYLIKALSLNRKLSLRNDNNIIQKKS